MLIVKTHLIVLLLIAGNAVTWTQVAGQDFMQNVNNERDRRAIDFGFFVRNLLLKSATASNAKNDISRNILNFKTATVAPPRRTTTTTTTTVAPFFFNKGPFRFPFDLSAPINNKFKGGYLNFDYDYGSQRPVRPGRRRRPTTTTTTTTTTTAAPPAATPAPPPPPRRRPIPRRPLGFFGKQKLPLYDYYYDDYDYNYDDASNAPANNAAAAKPTPAAPPTSPPPPNPAPVPNPQPAVPAKQTPANRNRALGRAPQLRNRLIYQFRQPGDTSTNNNAADQPAADAGSQQPPNTNANNSNNDETSTNANDDVYDDVYNDSDDDDVTASNGAANSNNNISDDNTPNAEQDNNNSSDNVNQNPNNANGNDSAPPPPPPPPALTNSDFDFNANGPLFRGQFSIAGNPNPSVFGNFAASGGFPYPPYSNFNPQYQSSAPAGYSVRYY